MEHLVQLFPSCTDADLQRHLDNAAGNLEVAINTILESSADQESSAVQLSATAPNQHHKRQKQYSVETIEVNGHSTEVWDLTLDSDGDDEDNHDNEGEWYKGTTENLDIFISQQPGIAIAAGSSSTGPQKPVASDSRPSFEDFHNEQQRLLEEQARKAAEVQEQKNKLVANFISIAQDMFENISVPYLERLLEETRPRFLSDDELVDACIEIIFALNGRYPKAKRKRLDDDDDDDEGEGGGSEPYNEGDEYVGGVAGDGDKNISKRQRDYMNCTIRMSAAYDAQSAIQLYQDFPRIAASSIRSCLKKFSFHYAPTFEYLNSLWTEFEPKGSQGKAKAGEIKIILVSVPRKKRPPLEPQGMDPEFRREMDWMKAKVAKELAEIQTIENEEKNTNYYRDRGELVECGCCYDDVPPNRVAQCEDGHLFCLECSRRGAEAELGYRRTVLKCMTDGCTAVFTDAEAVKFLPKPVLQGLFRARQQNELKMAGLDSLVECPFCSYAAVVENDQDKEFRCQAPRCRKVSCRLCKALTHIPQSCEEYRQELEKNNVLLVQHKVEEQMSEALIRECPQCKSRFFKTEGCNKMTCPECGTKMCYICKKKIRDYSHFDQSPASEPASRPTLCRLWDNTVERNTNDVKEAAQRMLHELQAETPDLAAKVRLDIPK